MNQEFRREQILETIDEYILWITIAMAIILFIYSLAKGGI